MRRAAYLTGRKFLPDFLPILSQPGAVIDHFALGRSPGSYAATFRAAIEVLITLLLTNQCHQATDTNLPFQLFPEKYQAGPGVFQQFLSFGAMIIGKECESSFIESF